MHDLIEGKLSTNDLIKSEINKFCNDLKECARDDYLSARRAYFFGETRHFFWHAQQSVEKYLKACALINGVNTKNDNHDLRKIYSKIKKIKPNLSELEDIFPSKIKTGEIKNVLGSNENLEEFLKRLMRLGMNRYGDESFYTLGCELLKLDAAISIIQRYCERPFEIEQNGVSIELCYPIFETFLGKILKNKDHDYYELLTFDNFFLPKKTEIPKDYISRLSAVYNSSLGILLSNLEGIDPKDTERWRVLLDALKYVIENTYISDGNKDEIRESAIKTAFSHGKISQTDVEPLVKKIMNLSGWRYPSVDLAQKKKDGTKYLVHPFDYMDKQSIQPLKRLQLSVENAKNRKMKGLFFFTNKEANKDTVPHDPEFLVELFDSRRIAKEIVKKYSETKKSKKTHDVGSYGNPPGN